MNDSEPDSLSENDALDLRKQVPPESGELESRRQVPPEGRASARLGSVSRRHPAHLPPIEASNRPIIIFVSACTAKRRKILASQGAHEALLKAWSIATKWIVGRYVVMPDHLHFFCAPNEHEAPPLEHWIRYWKSIATRNLGEPGGTVWQRNHWDRQLRSGESYDDKWDHVRSNPVRHGLVTEAEAWPYQGVLNELRW